VRQTRTERSAGQSWREHAGSLSPAIQAEYKSIRSTVSSIVRREGLHGFFRGFSAAALIIPLHWSLYFSTYDGVKGAVLESRPSVVPAALWPPLASATGALVAAVTTDTLTNPLWVVRTRLMTQHAHLAGGEDLGPSLGGPLAVLRRIYKEEGARALYRGLSASWFASSHVMIQFPAYELFRAEFQRWNRSKPPQERVTSDTPMLGRSSVASWLQLTPEDETSVVPVEPRPDGLQWWQLVAAASASKAIASSVTYPVEVIRCRIQDMRLAVPGSGVASPVPMPTLGAIFRSVVRTEGVTGLYAGFGMNLLRVIPACSITMLVYEALAREIAGWGM
jgi:solute carrier family 25 (mitochondrial folate transporter), member 32